MEQICIQTSAWPVKGQRVNILGFAHHKAYVPTTQTWSYVMEVATEERKWMSMAVCQ